MCGLDLLIHSQTATDAQLKLGTDKYFHRTLYNGYNYLFILGLNLIHGSKGAHGVLCVCCYVQLRLML